jgi:SAM-dependent methyltransferase
LSRTGSTRTATQRETEFFDDLVSLEGCFEPFADEAWTTLGHALDRYLPPGPRSLAVLDVGCGTGASERLYRRFARSYVGIDLSMTALSMASDAYPALRWMRADASFLPWSDASFDLVAFSSVLHHLPDMRPSLSEAFRVLRPGGFVFAFDPNLLHPAMALLRHPRSPFYSSEGVSPNERPLLPRELRRAFAAVGFDPIRQRGQAAIPYRRLAVGPLNRLLTLYNAVDRVMENVGLGRWIGPFVVTFAQRPGEPER